ncbi:FAD-dependent oxidoreductase, partial [Priestia filamentosa]|uniref:NAD(P)/FAD-dependent oxidoreductase n=1 Tax=Priestia filamentosa TaxID=1402861 RepID=UPI003979AAE9
VIVIDRNPYHSLKTEFYALAAGTVSDKDVRYSFPEHEQVEYIFGEVKKIETESKRVIVDKREVHYDHLVVGLGCEDHYHNVEGASEHAHSIQTIGKSRLAALEIGNTKANGDIIVVGAGLSGIEVAAEIRQSRPDLNIKLLDRGETVLRPFDPKIQKYVEKWFLENDIDVQHNAKVEYVEQGAVCNNGNCLYTDVTIWTAGVRPHKLVRELPFQKDTHERIVLNEYHQVPEDKTVYIVGDCASLPFSPSAQLAQHQGAQIANVLYDIVNNENPKKPGAIKLRGTLGSLGKHDGFGNMFELPFTGLVPRIAKSGVLWMHKRH